MNLLRVALGVRIPTVDPYPQDWEVPRLHRDSLNHGHDGRGVYPWGQTALVGCSSRLVTLGLTYADTNAFI